MGLWSARIPALIFLSVDTTFKLNKVQIDGKKGSYSTFEISLDTDGGTKDKPADVPKTAEPEYMEEARYMKSNGLDVKTIAAQIVKEKGVKMAEVLKNLSDLPE